MALSGNVYFKATKDHIIIMLNEESEFSLIRRDLREKVSEARKFFGNSKASIVFKGRALSRIEEKELLNIILAETDLNISSVTHQAGAFAPIGEKTPVKEVSRQLMENSGSMAMGEVAPIASVQPRLHGRAVPLEGNDQSRLHGRAVSPSGNDQPRLVLENGGGHSQRRKTGPLLAGEGFKPRIPRKQQPLMETDINSLIKWDNNNAVFYKGNIRSGVQFEHRGSVIIIGDINPGGEVIAEGNIIVLGSLKGAAHAGAGGNTDCFVAALNLMASQLRIANIVTSLAEAYEERQSVKGRKPQKQIVPSYAFIRGSQIYIAPLG